MVADTEAVDIEVVDIEAADIGVVDTRAADIEAVDTKAAEIVPLTAVLHKEGNFPHCCRYCCNRYTFFTS